MAAVTMVKMMVMTTMTTTTMNMKKMGNQVVGKWVQSSWQMGVLASLNVPPCCCCWTVLQCCWTVLQNCTHCTVFTAVVNVHLLLLLDCAAKLQKYKTPNALWAMCYSCCSFIHCTVFTTLQNYSYKTAIQYMLHRNC